MTKQQIVSACVWAWLVSHLWYCANPVALQGGPKDTQPPMVDSLRSTPNRLTRFDRKEITLRFDEYIDLKEAATQIVISPPLTTTPSYELKGKTLTVKLPADETLQPNTTYTINFGEALRDFTEGNVKKNFQYVFSTGDVIDSLSLNFRVKDIATGAPVESAFVLLYKNLADTAFQREPPYYFGKTDKDGQVSLNNLAAGTYRAAALIDGNVNYKYDLPTEKIAFLDSVIVLTADTDVTDFTFSMFLPEQPLRLLDREQPHFGLVKLTYNKPPEKVQLRFSETTDALKTLSYIQGDTLKIWYDHTSPAEWQLYTTGDSSIIDTINIKSLSRNDFFRKDTFGLFKPTGSGGGKKAIQKAVVQDQILTPAQVWEIIFSRPLRSLNTALIQLREDTTLTTVTATYAIDSLLPQKLRVSYPWREDTPYELVLPPLALTDFFGNTLPDTVRQRVQISNKKSLGDLTMSIAPLQPSVQYIVQLLQTDKVIKEQIVTNVDSLTVRYTALPIVDHTVRVIADTNRNGRWDSGEYASRRQPERIWTQKAVGLRANWELNLTLKIR